MVSRGFLLCSSEVEGDCIWQHQTTEAVPGATVQWKKLPLGICASHFRVLQLQPPVKVHPGGSTMGEALGPLPSYGGDSDGVLALNIHCHYKLTSIWENTLT